MVYEHVFIIPKYSKYLNIIIYIIYTLYVLYIYIYICVSNMHVILYKVTVRSFRPSVQNGISNAKVGTLQVLETRCRGKGGKGGRNWSWRWGLKMFLANRNIFTYNLYNIQLHTQVIHDTYVHIYIYIYRQIMHMIHDGFWSKKIGTNNPVLMRQLANEDGELQ